MSEVDLAFYRAQLEARREELRTLSLASKDARRPVELDQQAVGRLSRQDAIQQQAMSSAQEVRRAGELRRIEAAFRRIDEGEYGYCGECGEAISSKRLEIDLTAARCASCAAT